MSPKVFQTLKLLALNRWVCMKKLIIIYETKDVIKITASADSMCLPLCEKTCVYKNVDTYLPMSLALFAIRIVVVSRVV